MKITEVVSNSTTPQPFIFYGYHGTFSDDLPDSISVERFGGLHVGTEKAAMDRIDFTRGSRRQGKPGGENIIPVVVTLHKPFGPVDEIELSPIVNLKKGTYNNSHYLPSLSELKAEGYDGIVYKNMVEDPGSTSVLVFYRDRIVKGSTK
jgi:hypothetical protein